MSGVSIGLRGLISRLQAYRVDWKFSFVPTENKEYEPGTDRATVTNMADANVISSTLLHSHTVVDHDPSKPLSEQTMVPRHAVLLDVDYPAYVVESSTPQHCHVYLDVPGGVKHEDYMELLALLAKCGIIEQGYADVSIARGHSDLRLPWIHKEDQTLHADPQPAHETAMLNDGVPSDPF